MPFFNRVVLMGNSTRDPQLRHTTAGTAVTDVCLAINRRRKERNSDSATEETMYVEVTLWGKIAELAAEHLTKGRTAHIEGRLQQDHWHDRNTGQKRSRIKVVAESLQLMDRKTSGHPPVLLPDRPRLGDHNSRPQSA